MSSLTFLKKEEQRLIKRRNQYGQPYDTYKSIDDSLLTIKRLIKIELSKKKMEVSKWFVRIVVCR